MENKLLAKHRFFLEQILNTILEFEIHIFDDGGFTPILKKGDKVLEQHIKLLVEKGIDYIFIPQDQLRDYNFAVEKQLTDVLKRDDIPIKKRANILYGASVSLVGEFFDNANILKDGERIDNLVDNMVDFLTTNDNILSTMLSLSSHDFYTYRHSVDVANYTILFAKFIGVSDKKQLSLFGQAGLFHDLGKTSVSSDIINKKGPLSDDEWGIMKGHPTEGLKILEEIPSIPQEVIDATISHHEKMDGSGYPNGLMGENIPFFGRLVSISDIFSALTTHRSYSRARSPYEALDFMVENIKGKLDKKLLGTFIKIFKGA